MAFSEPAFVFRQGVQEISRFSCMLFLSVRGFFDYAFKQHLTMLPARLEARMDSLLSFSVGLFHPLQHAGLARRTPGYRLLVH